MPAAVRGGAKRPVKPQAKAPPSSRQRPAAPAPARQGGGLSAKWTLVGAGAVLALALGVTLATGHRGERLAQATGSAIDGKFGDAGFRLNSRSPHRGHRRPP